MGVTIKRFLTQNDTLTMDDFAIDETTETVERCPAGCVPESSVHDSEKGRTRTVMSASDCGSCVFALQCPAQRDGARYVLDHTSAQRRLAFRHRPAADYTPILTCVGSCSRMSLDL